jgi:hypothetical protein
MIGKAVFEYPDAFNDVSHDICRRYIGYTLSVSALVPELKELALQDAKRSASASYPVCQKSKQIASPMANPIFTNTPKKEIPKPKPISGHTAAFFFTLNLAASLTAKRAESKALSVKRGCSVPHR